MEDEYFVLEKKHLVAAILVLALVALAFCVVIQVEQTAQPAVLNGVCGVVTGRASSCSDVQSSQYGKILGIENQVFGMAAFGLLAAFAAGDLLMRNKLLRLGLVLGTIIGGLMAIYFVSIQAFVLHEFCIYCLGVDASAVLAMICGLFLGRGMIQWK